ncbi:MAG: PAS domain S-box protein [Pseudomonadales bacterium]|nr:PAS domain S-box protein [Pseudomonadales bacterium]
MLTLQVMRNQGLMTNQVPIASEVVQNDIHWRTLLEAIPDMIWLKDPEGVYLHCNKEFERFFGASEAEIVGKTDYDFVEKELADFFRAKDREAMTKGRACVNEEWITYAVDGRRVLLETTKKPMFDAQGQLLGILGIGHDITERKRLEAKLQESELFFLESQRAASIGSFKTDFATMTWHASEVLYDILGIDSHYPPTVDAWFDLIHPEDRDLVYAYVQKNVLNQHEAFRREYRIVRPSDGNIRWVLGQGKLVLDDDGQIKFIVGTLQDITRQQQSRHELALVSFALNHVQDAAYLVDERGHFLFVNDEAVRIHGYSRDELLRLRVIDVDNVLRTEEQWSDHWQYMKSVQTMTFQSQHRRCDGVNFPVEITANYFEFLNQPYMLGLARDISERAAMHDELLRHRTHLEELVKDKTQELADANQKLTRLSRIQRAISLSSQALVHATSEQEYRQKVCQLLVEVCGHSLVWIGHVLADAENTVQVQASAGEGQAWLSAQVMTRQDGSLGQGPCSQALCSGFAVNMDLTHEQEPWAQQAKQQGWMSCLVVPFCLDDGQAGLFTMYTDVHADMCEDELRLLQEMVQDYVQGMAVLRLRRRHAEIMDELAVRVRDESLARQQNQALAEKLQLVLDSLEAAILVWDKDKRLAFWNQNALDIFPLSAHRIRSGLQRDDFLEELNRNGEKYDSTRPWEAWQDPVHELVHTHQGWVLEFTRRLAQDGSRIVLISDNTEITMMRDTLQGNQRMADLGGMVAGVAHDLNTPIGIALTASTTLAEGVRRIEQEAMQGEMRRSLFTAFLEQSQLASHLIESNLNRAIELITSFKQVAVDRTQAQRRTFDLGSMLQEVMVMMQPLLKPQGHRWRLDRHTGEVNMGSYPGPLGQVITNLVQNAVTHAFVDHPGQIILSIREREYDQVEIKVTDNGRGIPPENLLRIFTPFFTTRLGQGGTGLGLHISHRIVTNILQGSIGVNSVLGEGTEFCIVIPCFPKDKQETTP